MDANPVAWMKPDEISGLLKAAGEGASTRYGDEPNRYYGRVYARQYDADMVPVCRAPAAAHAAGGLGLKAEHIAAIESLGRDDPAVHAFLRLKRQDQLEWGDVLAQMVLHLAKDKAALTARLVDAERNKPADAHFRKFLNSPESSPKIDYSILNAYADKHRLHFKGLCEMVQSACNT